MCCLIRSSTSSESLLSGICLPRSSSSIKALHFTRELLTVRHEFRKLRWGCQCYTDDRHHQCSTEDVYRYTYCKQCYGDHKQERAGKKLTFHTQNLVRTIQETRNVSTQQVKRKTIKELDKQLNAVEICCPLCSEYCKSKQFYSLWPIQYKKLQHRIKYKGTVGWKHLSQDGGDEEKFAVWHE